MVHRDVAKLFQGFHPFQIVQDFLSLEVEGGLCEKIQGNRTGVVCGVFPNDLSDELQGVALLLEQDSAYAPVIKSEE